MEAFFVIIILIAIFLVFGNATNDTGASVNQPINSNKTYFGPAQLKFVDDVVEDTGWTVKRIMFRGKLPNTQSMNISFAISAFDGPDDEKGEKGEFKPVLSLIDTAQEDTTICYYRSGDFGRVVVGASITDWVQLGVAIPELLQTPCSGNRRIHMVVRMFNSDNPPTITSGHASADGENIFFATLPFSHNFPDKGYEEVSKDREEAQAISLKIGVAVAMADGSLDDIEGKVLKDWIIKEISPFSGDKQKKLKALFNKSLKEGFAQAKKGVLSLSDLVDRLSEIGDKKSKYDAIELCFDVMAADGIADTEEMLIIRNVANSLDLDMDEIEKMREEVTLNLSGELTSEEGMESLVGLESSWSDDKKRKHLRSEFQKWSNRLNSFPEGEDRKSAQNMLDNIATLRKKYG